MPEGPEILYSATYFNSKLQGVKLTNIVVNSDKKITIPKDLSKGYKVVDVSSKGKLLFFKLKYKTSIYYLHIHYGLTGWLVFDKPEKNIKYEFVFNNNEILYMEDVRRFSSISFCNQEEHDDILDKLGVDIFSKDFTLEYFSDKLNNTNSILASFLLKQDMFAGIGNYIKNESLYLANIPVKIKTGSLTNKQITDLYNKILFVAFSNLVDLLKSKKILSKLNSSYKYNMPNKLQVPYIYQIYDREFTTDNKKVYKIKVGGRDTYCTKELCK